MPQIQYTEKVKEHFKNPHNQGSIENPDGLGEVGNPACGDMMRLYIKVEKDDQGKEVLSDIKFETLGCAAAIATSSMITDMAKEKTLDEALKISKAQVSEELGGLPPIKEHCSNLAADALQAAIKNYREKK